MGSNPAGLTNQIKDLDDILLWILGLGFQWGSTGAIFWFNYSDFADDPSLLKVLNDGVEPQLAWSRCG